MTDISGLKAALTLAGQNTTESCGATAAFGSAAYYNKYGPSASAGLGGGGYYYGQYGGVGGAGGVGLYFT